MITTPATGNGEVCSLPPLPAPKDSAAPPTKSPVWRYLLLGLLLAAAWTGLYYSLAPIAKWLTYSLFRLSPGAHLSAAVEFFLFEVPKVLLLLTVVVFVVGIIRSFFTPERTRAILAGKRESVGNVLAACLGIVTPFCSCSAVPLFIGFVTAGVPLGVTFSFLVAAPMINEIALGCQATIILHHQRQLESTMTMVGPESACVAAVERSETAATHAAGRNVRPLMSSTSGRAVAPR